MSGCQRCVLFHSGVIVEVTCITNVHFLKDAVRIQKKFADVDESTVEDKIKSWLRHAPGRTKRISGNNDEETRGGE